MCIPLSVTRQSSASKRKRYVMLMSYTCHGATQNRRHLVDVLPKSAFRAISLPPSVLFLFLSVNNRSVFHIYTNITGYNSNVNVNSLSLVNVVLLRRKRTSARQQSSTWRTDGLAPSGGTMRSAMIPAQAHRGKWRFEPACFDNIYVVPKTLLKLPPTKSPLQHH